MKPKFERDSGGAVILFCTKPSHKGRREDKKNIFHLSFTAFVSLAIFGTYSEEMPGLFRPKNETVSFPQVQISLSALVYFTEVWLKRNQAS